MEVEKRKVKCQTSEAEDLPANVFSNKKALLVEDQPVTAASVLDEVLRMGCSLTGIAGSAKEAVSAIESFTPDIVIFGRHFQTCDESSRLEQVIRTRFGVPVHCLNSFENLLVSDSTQTESSPMSALLLERQRHFWLASALNSAADGIVIVDPEGGVRFLNRAAERLTGWTYETAAGKDYCEVLHFEHDGVRVTGNLLGLAALSEEPLGLGQDLLLVSLNGARHEVEGEVSAANESQGAFGSVVFTFRDVTHRKWEEKQHRHEQAIRAVERVAETTAHTLNNLLTTILGNGELLMHSKDLPDEHRETIRQINLAAQNVAAVVRQLSTISRNRFVTLGEINLNELIRSYAPVLQSLLGHNVHLTTEFDPSIRAVTADRGQLEQVLFALASNARDAIATVGDITISTHSVLMDTPERLRPSRTYVAVKVRDSGEGMTPETIERIFEPFFTLRRERGNVGLGLSIAQGIVRDYQGFIDVTSEPGVGTEVTFALPAMEAAALAYLDRKNSQTSELGVKTILVVEDDHAVRQLLRKILEKHDYTVIEAKDGADALLVAELHDAEVNLLISDVAMPGMTGPDLVREFAFSHPETKFLLISGFSAEKIGNRSTLPAGLEFLPKPFKQRELLARIEDLLKPEAGAGRSET